MSYPEAPDNTGVAPKHKEAAERAKAGEANNTPMTQSCEYLSDRVRLGYILKATSSENTAVKPTELNPDNDFVVVKKKGDEIYYYEKWVRACWSALYKKPQYKGKKKIEAIELFMKDRFSKIAELSGNKVVQFKYTNGILFVEMKHMRDA